MDHYLGQLNEALAQDLIDACATGNLTQLKTLFPQYESVPAESVPTPQFLLQTAARNGQAEIVRLIWSLLPYDTRAPQQPWNPNIPKGVKFDAIPKKWRICQDGVIYEALESSEPLDVFKVFFDFGMRPDHNLERVGNTTSFAIAYNRVNLVRFFLQQGAKPTGRYLQHHDTYLGAAARRPSTDMLNLLVEYGSELKGSQALRQAAKAGQLQNAKILLDLGADVNEVFHKYNYLEDKYVILGCPLHFAVIGSSPQSERQASNLEMVELLLSHGARTNVVDGQGRTPVQIALQGSDSDIVKVLKAHSDKE